MTLKMRSYVVRQTLKDLNEDIEVNEIDGNENDQHSEISDISETYTEILEQINKPKKLEINTGDMNRPSTSRVKPPDNSPRNSPRSSPRWTPPTYYTESYQQSDRNNAIWNSRLNKNWTPKPANEQYNFLDLDCVADINKVILLWIGNMSKQLIDNKIETTKTQRYVERTFVGTTKLWIENLPSESLEVLRNDKKMDGSASATNIDILDKYESATRNEFGGMTTDIGEQNREKNNK